MKKSTTIKCGVSKQTEKAVEVAISNNEGIHFIWLPKSQIKIITINDNEDSYGFKNVNAALIRVPNWLFKNFLEKGINYVADEIGETFSVKLRLLA